jgi:hypothetical protein
MVYIAHTGGGNECPMTAKNLDAGQIDFVRKCGLTPERASALRMGSSVQANDLPPGLLGILTDQDGSNNRPA